METSSLETRTISRLCSAGYVQNHTRGIFPGITRTGTCVSSVGLHTRTRNLCECCTTFIPIPESSVSSARLCHNTRGTGTTFVYLPGISVSSVRIPYRTRNFCGFCKTSIPVPGTSVSSVRLPYPYPESNNPTKRLQRHRSHDGWRNSPGCVLCPDWNTGCNGRSCTRRSPHANKVRYTMMKILVLTHALPIRSRRPHSSSYGSPCRYTIISIIILQSIHTIIKIIIS